ncbi:MAG: sugar-binding transcriptional regulator [Oscillospiraceae bacterium]|nr:sugar-binding transcriptional regulator [Oscillospiraceae bacterium]
MKRIVDDERLMLQVCELYYNQDFGQQGIAEHLGISRPTVSRLLQGAKERGIVRIIINDLSGRHHLDIEDKLMEKYGLRQAIVVDTFEDRDKLHAELGAAAARFLARIIKNGDTIGVSMGVTLSQIAPHVGVSHFQNLTFLPILGGVGTVALELHSNYLALGLANAYGGESLVLHAPSMVSCERVKETLMQEAHIATVLARAARMDIALIGIGAPDLESTMLATGYFSPEMFEDFAENNICGDICLRFFDREGNISQYEHNQRVIGVALESLHKIPWSIGVAGGIKKVDAIRGALLGQYVNVLITDIGCAKALL